MLQPRNMLVARLGIPRARLTMKFEIATLHASSPRVALHLRSRFRGRAREGQRRIKAMFYDVLGHFRRRGVANRRQSVAMVVVIGVALLGGCAGMGGLSANTPADVKQEAVSARAKARWDRLIAGDLAGAYTYLSPASKATMPLDVYKAKHKVGMYRSVRIDDVECKADTCTVSLHLTYDYKRARSARAITTPLTEKWIISDGQAWFVDRG